MIRRSVCVSVFLRRFQLRDIGIDLGTANTLIYVSGRESCCRAISSGSDANGTTMAVGDVPVDLGRTLETSGLFVRCVMG